LSGVAAGSGPPRSDTHAKDATAAKGKRTKVPTELREALGEPGRLAPRGVFAGKTAGEKSAHSIRFTRQYSEQQFSQRADVLQYCRADQICRRCQLGKAFCWETIRRPAGPPSGASQQFAAVDPFAGYRDERFYRSSTRRWRWQTPTGPGCRPDL